MDVKPKGILRRLVEFAVNGMDRRSRPPGARSSLPPAAVERVIDTPRPPAVASVTRVATAADEDGSISLEVVWSAPDEARIRWSLREEDLEPARALMHANAQLAVRTVAFSADRSGVLREASDVAVSNLDGELLLHRARPERLLVAVGLLHEAEFCSIAHLEVR
jgi:hypothetical protein